jgi:hypothetical protein
MNNIPNPSNVNVEKFIATRVPIPIANPSRKRTIIIL